MQYAEKISPWWGHCAMFQSLCFSAQASLSYQITLLYDSYDTSNLPRDPVGTDSLPHIYTWMMQLLWHER